LLLRNDEQTFPEGKDLFQLLWCPTIHEYDDSYTVRIVHYWRSIQEVERINAQVPTGYVFSLSLSLSLSCSSSNVVVVVMFPQNRQPLHPLPKEYPRCDTVPAPCWLSPELVTGTMFNTLPTPVTPVTHTAHKPSHHLIFVLWCLLDLVTDYPPVHDLPPALGAAVRSYNWPTVTGRRRRTTPSPSLRPPPPPFTCLFACLLDCIQTSCGQPWTKMKIGASTQPLQVPSLPQLFFFLTHPAGCDVVGWVGCCRAQGGRLR
jgi:hypothetical protein